VPLWGVLSDERSGLYFTVAAGPRQRSHARSTLSDDRSGMSFLIHLLLSVHSQSACTKGIYIIFV
jgi:hypothetical protein